MCNVITWAEWEHALKVGEVIPLKGKKDIAQRIKEAFAFERGQKNIKLTVPMVRIMRNPNACTSHRDLEKLDDLCDKAGYLKRSYPVVDGQVTGPVYSLTDRGRDILSRWDTGKDL